MKIIENDQQLISLVKKDKQEKALDILIASNSKFVLFSLILLFIFIMITYLSLGFDQSFYFLKYFIISLLLINFVHRLNHRIAVNRVIDNYIEMKVKYKISYLQIMDSIILSIVIIALFFM